MKSNIEKRLEQLKEELNTGQQVLSELEVRKADTTQTLLRISGAIQVLEELLDSEESNVTEMAEKEAKTA